MYAPVLGYPRATHGFFLDVGAIILDRRSISRARQPRQRIFSASKTIF